MKTVDFIVSLQSLLISYRSEVKHIDSTELAVPMTCVFVLKDDSDSVSIMRLHLDGLNSCVFRMEK